MIHDSAKAEQAQHNLNTLQCIITYCCLLFRIQGVQLNRIAEGNIGTLEADRLILDVKLDRNGEEKFQPTVPDVVRVQHKAFNPGGRVNMESSRLYPWYDLPGQGTASIKDADVPRK